MFPTFQFREESIAGNVTVKREITKKSIYEARERYYFFRTIAVFPVCSFFNKRTDK
jgi:hypothetical protein